MDTPPLKGAICDYDVALVVLDPRLSMVDAAVNNYRAREVRDALEPLLPIADSTGCALFELAHFTKASDSDPLVLISGSGAFGQLVRAGIGYAVRSAHVTGPAAFDNGGRSAQDRLPRMFTILKAQRAA